MKIKKRNFAILSVLAVLIISIAIVTAINSPKYPRLEAQSISSSGIVNLSDISQITGTLTTENGGTGVVSAQLTEGALIYYNGLSLDSTPTILFDGGDSTGLVFFDQAYIEMGSAGRILDIGGEFSFTGQINSESGYSVVGTPGVTDSGTSCTITAISGGIITGATCV